MPPKSSRGGTKSRGGGATRGAAAARGGGAARGVGTRRKAKASTTATPAITPAAAFAMGAVPPTVQEVTEDADVISSFLPFEESLTPRYTAKDLNVFIDRGNPRNPHRKQICLSCKTLNETNPAALIDDNRVWKYSCRTSTTILRDHLLRHHRDEWIATAQERGWQDLITKYILEPNGAPGPDAQDYMGVLAFNRENFKNALVRFIAADDQSLRLVEVPEFRSLLRMLKPDLREQDIPGRSKMRLNVLEEYQRVMCIIKAHLSTALGKVSMTTDLWSNKKLMSYMALTSHYIARSIEGALTMQSIMIAFHPMIGSHNRENLGTCLLQMAERAGIKHNLGWITSDNAAVNGAMMRHIEDALKKEGHTHFDAKDRRIICFPHVLHICVTKILDYVEKFGQKTKGGESGRATGDIDIEDADEADDYDDIPPPPPRSSSKQSDADAERRNPLGLLRTIIRIIRRSGKRCQDFHDCIIHGNTNRLFQTKTPVPVLELLRDVPTRWDSTFLMIDRAERLRHALDFYCKTTPELENYTLSPAEWNVLRDLGMVLLVPFEFTQRFTSDQTPSLSFIISSFERLLTNWEKMHERVRATKASGLNWERIKRYAYIGRDAALKYYNKLDDSWAYVISMFLNPHVRDTWILEHWEKEKYYQPAIEAILTTMHKYADCVPPAEEEEEEGEEVFDLENLSDASDNSSAGDFDDFNAFADISFRTLGRGLGVFNDLNPPPAQGTGIKTPEQEFELYRKLTDLVPPAQLSKMSILEFWTQHEQQFPILFQMALDYLPIQASSVPCERAFSSCAETDTKRRNRLSPAVVEALQILKGWYKKERTMDFVSTWVSTEQELTMENPEIDHLAVLTSSDDLSQTNLGQVIANLVQEEGVHDTDTLI